MTRNITGGKKYKSKKKTPTNDDTADKKKVVYAEEDQLYAIVDGKDGGSRLSVTCSDGEKRSARIPGKFFKRVWFNKGDVVLCNINIDGADKVCEIEHKYTNRDAMTLKNQKLISFEIQNTEPAINFVEESTVISQNKNRYDFPSSESESDSDSDVVVANHKKNKNDGDIDIDIDIDDL
jgi:translation initiation factor 1A